MGISDYHLIVIVIAAIFGVMKNEIVLCVMAANISVAISLILAKIIDWMSNMYEFVSFMYLSLLFNHFSIR